MKKAGSLCQNDRHVAGTRLSPVQFTKVRVRQIKMNVLRDAGIPEAFTPICQQKQ
jgi:hypothetical protein